MLSESRSIYRVWDTYKWQYCKIPRDIHICLNTQQKDCQGREIYEGDILLLEEEDETWLGIVAFGSYELPFLDSSGKINSVSAYGFYVHWIYPRFSREIYGFTECDTDQISSEMEVIGNIYESIDFYQASELLDKK